MILKRTKFFVLSHQVLTDSLWWEVKKQLAIVQRFFLFQKLYSQNNLKLQLELI